MTSKNYHHYGDEKFAKQPPSYEYDYDDEEEPEEEGEYIEMS